jgi:hypothetical protein
METRRDQLLVHVEILPREWITYMMMPHSWDEVHESVDQIKDPATVELALRIGLQVIASAGHPRVCQVPALVKQQATSRELSRFRPFVGSGVGPVSGSVSPA